MIREEYLNKFNPHAKVPFARVREAYQTVKMFADTGNKTSADKDKSVSAEAMTMGVEIARKVEEAKENLKSELITIFYNLSNVERDDLDIVEREEMYQKIESTRSDVTDFLGISSKRNQHQTDSATSSEVTST